MSSIQVARTVNELRETVRGWRHVGQQVCLVPTMGALHAGHLNLIERARAQADRTVVSIFVNPAQFAPAEDFGAYPRDERGDMMKLSEHSVDLAFVPPSDEVYPEGFCTRVEVAGPAAAGLEDRFRPHFFSGVATVVGKLLNQSGCDSAIFGEKDYQQLLVIRQMARDLDIPCRIVAGETVREPDGLALSSRNAYLSVAERRIAPLLYETLRDTAERLRLGAAADEAAENARATLEAAGFRVDYVEVRNADTLAPAGESAPDDPRRILAAAHLGTTRLIDNVPV